MVGNIVDILLAPSFNTHTTTAGVKQARWDDHVDVVPALAINDRHTQCLRRDPQAVELFDIPVDDRVALEPQFFRHPCLGDAANSNGVGKSNAKPLDHVREIENN